MLSHVTMCCTSDVIFRKEAKVFVAYLRSDFERQAQCLESSFSSNMKKSSASLRKFYRNQSFGGVVAIFHVAMTAYFQRLFS